MSRYSFGIYGCWFMDPEGNLEYVHEQDYTGRRKNSHTPTMNWCSCARAG